MLSLQKKDRFSWAGSADLFEEIVVIEIRVVKEEESITSSEERLLPSNTILGIPEWNIDFVEPHSTISISREELKKHVFEYIKEHPGCLTSDIIIDFDLDPDLALEILEELKKEGKIEDRDVSED